jgi:hypothetical protein
MIVAKAYNKNSVSTGHVWKMALHGGNYYELDEWVIDTLEIPGVYYVVVSKNRFELTPRGEATLNEAPEGQ